MFNYQNGGEQFEWRLICGWFIGVALNPFEWRKYHIRDDKSDKVCIEIKRGRNRRREVLWINNYAEPFHIWCKKKSFFLLRIRCGRAKLGVVQWLNIFSVLQFIFQTELIFNQIFCNRLIFQFSMRIVGKHTSNTHVRDNVDFFYKYTLIYYIEPWISR